MSAGKLFVGTSGFAFKEWKGVFYPEGVTDKKMLSYYSRQLRSVEINYTFRRMPSESTLANWKAETPDGFRFTLKAPQRITHFKRLVDTEEDVAEFIRRALTLEDRLGTLLFQLPPNMKYSRPVLEGFLSSLPPMARCSMEFRHESWRAGEVKELLAAHKVAWCGADTPETPVSDVPLTAPHAYLRLRREEYADEDLADWGRRLARVLKEGHDVYCYLKHEGGGVGPVYARKVLDAAGAELDRLGP
jgi:uncharacterized protein YecE (DUF72 family)